MSPKSLGWAASAELYFYCWLNNPRVPNRYLQGRGILLGAIFATQNTTIVAHQYTTIVAHQYVDPTEPPNNGTGVSASSSHYDDASSRHYDDDAPDFVQPCSIPEAMYITAVFVGGDWERLAFSVPGQMVCMALSTIGVFLYALVVGAIYEAVESTIQEQKERHRHYIFMRKKRIGLRRARSGLPYDAQ